MSEPADPLRHALTPDAHREIYETQIRPALIRGTPQARPRVTILGGQPGSGKTRALDALPAGSRPDGIVIASDRLRQYHPLWPELLRRDDTTAGFYTSHDARAWVAGAISDAIAGRLNVMLDTASDDPAVPHPHGVRGHRVYLRAGQQLYGNELTASGTWSSLEGSTRRDAWSRFSRMTSRSLGSAR